MSHPPIAPNALLRTGFNMSDTLWGNDNLSFVLDQYSMTQRRLIADHNRCAWLDEANHKTHFNMPEVKQMKLITITEQEYRDFYAMDCEERADRWRLWGEQK
jgi:hypothetical protein